MSLIEHQPAPNLPQVEQKRARPKRVPAKIVRILDLVSSGTCKSVNAACERIKLDQSYAYRELRKPHVVSYIEGRTRAAIALSQTPAAATLINLLEHAQSEHVQKDVAIHLLALNGHKPKSEQQLSVSIDLKAGFVIDLSEPGPKPIDVTATHD